MKIYYYNKQNFKYAGFDVVPDTIVDIEGQEQPYPIPEYSTDIKPDFSLLGLYFDVDGQAWKGLSQEEYDKQNPPTPPSGWEDKPSELEILQKRQDATEQALQDLILSTMSND